MLAGIVDNSSLTSCQRLLGDIRVGNLHNIDGDISAFENVIQAILLYQRLYCLDDYKDEFKESRRHRFPFLQGITLTERKQEELVTASEALTADLTALSRDR